MKKRLEAIEKREQQVKRSNENLQRQRGRIEDVKIQLDVRKRKLDEQKRAQTEEAARLEQLHKQIGRKRALAKHEKKEAVELRKSLVLTLAQAKSDGSIAEIETKFKPMRSKSTKMPQKPSVLASDYARHAQSMDHYAVRLENARYNLSDQSEPTGPSPSVQALSFIEPSLENISELNSVNELSAHASGTPIHGSRSPSPLRSPRSPNIPQEYDSNEIVNFDGTRETERLTLLAKLGPLNLEEKGRTLETPKARKLDLQRRETELQRKMEQLEIREKELERKLREFKILTAENDGIKENSANVSSARGSIDLGVISKLNSHTSPQLFTAQTLSMIAQAAVSPKLGSQQLDGIDSRVSISLQNIDFLVSDSSSEKSIDDSSSELNEHRPDSITQMSRDVESKSTLLKYTSPMSKSNLPDAESVITHYFYKGLRKLKYLASKNDGGISHLGGKSQLESKLPEVETIIIHHYCKTLESIKDLVATGNGWMKDALLPIRRVKTPRGKRNSIENLNVLSSMKQFKQEDEQNRGGDWKSRFEDKVDDMKLMSQVQRPPALERNNVPLWSDDIKIHVGQTQSPPLIKHRRTWSLSNTKRRRKRASQSLEIYNQELIDFPSTTVV